MKRLLLLTALLSLVCLSAVAQRQRQSGVSIPAGTVLEVRIDDNLNSEKTKEGDTFTGTLPKPVVVNGRNVFQKGAMVDGHVSKAKPSGRLSDPGELELVIDRIGNTNVFVEPFLIKGASHTKSNVAKIGGSAAAGAIIGGLTGGGKGAAIGAAVGTAAGTGVAAATGKKEAVVESEAILPFKFAETPANGGGNWSGHWSPNYVPEFTARDRRIIRSCLTDTKGLPPGLAKKEKLPPGLEKQVQRNGTLPPGLQKKVQPMPLACEQQLPHLPTDVERVILNRNILMLGAQERILDLFNLDYD